MSSKKQLSERVKELETALKEIQDVTCQHKDSGLVLYRKLHALSKLALEGKADE